MWYMNEEREMLRAAFREFAQKKVRPHVAKMEEEEAGCKDLILEMGQLGFLGMAMPEELGGGGDWTSFGILMEELGRESYTVALSAMITNQFIQGMKDACTEEQIQKYVLPVMNGEKVLAAASCEASGSAFFEGYQTRAVRDGDDWVINGDKCFITLIDIADIIIVVALTSEKINLLTGEGFTYFIVPADTPGVSFGHMENKIGWKGSRTGSVYFENVRVPDANRIPKPMFTKPGGGTGTAYAAIDLGGCEVILEKAIAYVKGRIQEGGLSLWELHESLRNDIARLAAKVQVLRNAVYGELQNVSNGDDSFLGDSALKIEGAKTLIEVANECMLFMGATGYIKETGIERYYRDVVLSEVGCGSNKAALSTISMFL